MKSILLFICIVTTSIQAWSQTPLSKDDKRAQKEIQKKERAKVEAMLKSYTDCPETETAFVVYAARRVDKNANRTLARDTVGGVKGISRTDSYDVLITFKDKMRFANVRPDRSDPDQFETDKKVAYENLEYNNAGMSSMSTSKPVEKTFNGFTTYSIYRKGLIGNQLGISLIYDDVNGMITTVYFINAPKNADGKNYRTIEEWSTLREEFLDRYTGCLAKSLGVN